MGTTPEGKVKNYAKNRLKRELPGVWLYSAPGGMYGQAGTPDLLGLWQGVFFAIEFKADSNKDPTKLQWKRLTELKDQGAISAVLRGRDVAKMDKIIEAIRRRADEFAHCIF